MRWSGATPPRVQSTELDLCSLESNACNVTLLYLTLTQPASGSVRCITGTPDRQKRIQVRGYGGVEKAILRYEPLPNQESSGQPAGVTDRCRRGALLPVNAVLPDRLVCRAGNRSGVTRATPQRQGRTTEAG